MIVYANINPTDYIHCPLVLLVQLGQKSDTKLSTLDKRSVKDGKSTFNHDLGIKALGHMLKELTMCIF